MAIEIIAEFESTSKFFASFSKFFLGGIVGYQWVIAEKIWNREFFWIGGVPLKVGANANAI